VKVALVHGFNVKAGAAQSTDRLMRPLGNRGYLVEDWDYGWLGLVGVRLYAKKIAQRVAERIMAEHAPVSLVAHSNGCYIVDRALWHIAETYAQAPNVHRIVYLSPALDRDTKYPPLPMDSVHVFHTERDYAVKFADLLRGHPWGGMGAHGAQAIGYINHDFTPEIDAHSAWVYDHMTEFTASRIDQVLQ